MDIVLSHKFFIGLIFFGLLGVYSVAIDAEHGTVKVHGKVNPYMILKVLDKYGKDGEISNVNFHGQVMKLPSYYYHQTPPAYIPYEAAYAYYPCNSYNPPPFQEPIPSWYDRGRGRLPPVGVSPPPPPTPPPPPAPPRSYFPPNPPSVALPLDDQGTCM